MSTSIGPEELLRGPSRRPRFRRGLAASVALVLGATGISASMAQEVVTPNTGHLVKAGPVNSSHGFPAWYQDDAGVRTELCLQGSDPLCGFVAEEGFDPDQPTDFETNFPGESFYMLAGSEIALEGGGTAGLVLALEAAFANDIVKHGDQVVFGRLRVDVKDGPPNSTLTFTHPYGVLTVDTDADGRGRLVEDKYPAFGNFDAALQSDVGPFLKWDSGAPEGYLGNPDIDHRITGSPFGTNFFAAEHNGVELGRTDLFSLMGKISTNTGVKADQAVVNGNFIDVFATSEGTQIQAHGPDGTLYPMNTDPGSNRHYVRMPFTGTPPSTVKVTNIGDVPESTSDVPVTTPSGITVLDATYNGTSQDLTVTARSTKGAPTLEGVGFGALTATGAKDTYAGTFKSIAPPASVTVSVDGGKATLPVTVTDGTADDAGLPEIENPAPTPDEPAGEEPAGEQPAGEEPAGEQPAGEEPAGEQPAGEEPAGEEPAGEQPAGEEPAGEQPTTVDAVVAQDAMTVGRGATIQLDGSGSTGATSYSWSQPEGQNLTITDDTTDDTGAKATVSIPFFTTTDATAPVAESNTPPVYKFILTATGDGGTDTAEVTVTVQNDNVTVTDARFRDGREFRANGTAIPLDGVTLLTPPTSVIVYNNSPGRVGEKLGVARVDTLGNWTLRLRDNLPSSPVTSIKVESTRGDVEVFDQVQVR